MEVILNGSFPSGNFPGGSYPRWEFSLLEAFRVGIIWVGAILGEIFLSGSYPGWEFSLGGSLLGGNCPGE